MNAANFKVEELLKLAHSPVRNYIIPGLTSYLIGGKSPTGLVRLFRCGRDHQEEITPHSHRFDFQCWVLAGRVRNRVWAREHPKDMQGDFFVESRLKFSGDMGDYSKIAAGVSRWTYTDHLYEAGECYAMSANEMHSIKFDRGTDVLFFEGPTTRDFSVVIEPSVDGKQIPTFQVHDWMFQGTEGHTTGGVS